MRAVTAGADETRRSRVAAQGLDGRATTVVEAVRRIVGVQAQDPRAARLAVRVRTAGLTAADVDDAVRAGRVVRTWAMRGTLHLVAAEDFWWLRTVLGEYFAARGAPRRRQLGLDDALLDRAATALERELTVPRTRAEIVARLAGHGVVLDPRSQQPPHLLAWAANTGLICRGPDIDDATLSDTPSYVLAREWLGPAPAPDPDAALTELARRYLHGYGPATAADLAAWSGLPLTRVRPAFAAAARPPAEPAPPGLVRLLGHFDAYLLGYRGRELAVPAGLARRVQAGGGFVMPSVTVDGRVVGLWRQTAGAGGLIVHADVGRTVLARLSDEVADLGRFLGRPSELVPLNG